MKRLLFALVLLNTVPTAHASHADACVRAEPEPAFQRGRTGLRDHRFVVRSPHEAVENLTLTSGEHIEIRHGGCEYVVAAFHIRGAGLFLGAVTPGQAYSKAAQLLRRLHGMPARAGFDLALAARALDGAGRRQVPFGESVAVDGDGVDFLQAQVQLDGAGRKGGKGYLKVSLIRGPL